MAEEQKETTKTITAAEIAAEVAKAIEGRTQRVEKSIAKSFAEQYGMTEEDVLSAVNDAKAKKAAQIPAALQAQIDAKNAAANNRLIMLEMQTEGAKRGLLDAEGALTLIGKDKIGVNEKGEVSGVSDALDELQKTKPYFFKAVPTGQQTTIGAKITGNAEPISGVEAEFLKRNPGLKID